MAYQPPPPHHPAPQQNTTLFVPPPYASPQPHSQYASPAPGTGAPPSAYSSPHVGISTVPPPALPPKEPFAIKVMRLPSPAFHSLTPVAWRPDAHLSSAPAATPFAFSSSLLLPTNIGTVYLGETFRACVSIWQQGAAHTQLHTVGIKLELQTSSRRWTLVDTTAPTQLVTMAGGQTKDLLVSHNLAELGVNCLECLVTYKDDTTGGERKNFRKFFKFHVHDPFSIHTTIHAREGILIAEVALTSLIQRAVTLTRVQFEQADKRIEVEDLNGDVLTPHDTNATHNNTPVPVPAGVLLPGASSRSFLFRFLIPNEYTDALLGRLQIRWSSLAGENGRIKSSGISRTLKGGITSAANGPGSTAAGGVECLLLDAPAAVQVESVFTVVAQVRNATGQPCLGVVQLLKERMGTLLPLGPSTRQLGMLQPGAALVLAIELVGVGLGVQRISGIRVALTPCAPGTQTPNKNGVVITSDFDHLHQLEVTPTAPLVEVI